MDTNLQYTRTVVRQWIVAATGLILIAPLASCVATVPGDATPGTTPSAAPGAISQTRAPGSTFATEMLPPSVTHACTSPERYDAYKVDAGEWQWSITGVRVDTGTAEHATGTANDDLTEYVVGSGDTFTGIGDRFCIDSIHLAMINHRDSVELYTGETIRLFPDGPAADYFSDPDD